LEDSIICAKGFQKKESNSTAVKVVVGPSFVKEKGKSKQQPLFFCFHDLAPSILPIFRSASTPPAAVASMQSCRNCDQRASRCWVRPRVEPIEDAIYHLWRHCIYLAVPTPWMLLTPKFGKESDLWVRFDKESVWWKEGFFQRYSARRSAVGYLLRFGKGTVELILRDRTVTWLNQGRRMDG
jgi:hypothetical protein